MSILIKGTTMPKNCNACLFAVMTSLGDFCNIAKMNINYQTEYCSKHPECPLVEVPTPHGDLIDKNALTHEYYKKASYSHLCDCLNNAPTIIESEGE